MADGMVHFDSRFRQRIKFEGMTYQRLCGRNITPTDVDGLIHFENERLWIFFELKKSGTPVPVGQHKWMLDTTGTISKSGASCWALIGEHDTPSTSDIIAKDCIVTQFYKNGEGPILANKKTKLIDATNIIYKQHFLTNQ